MVHMVPAIMVKYLSSNTFMHTPSIKFFLPRVILNATLLSWRWADRGQSVLLSQNPWRAAETGLDLRGAWGCQLDNELNGHLHI